MASLRDFAREQLARAAQRSLARQVIPTERLGGLEYVVGVRNTSRSVAMTISASRIIRRSLPRPRLP